MVFIKKRDILFAKKSMIVAAIFGLLTSFFVILTGDESAHQVALKQPVKLAAMEGLYEGKEQAGIVGIGILNPNKTLKNDEEPYLFELEAPYALSLMGYHDIDAFVPGLNDLVYGNEKYGIEAVSSKMEKGKKAIAALKDYKKLKKKIT